MKTRLSTRDAANDPSTDRVLSFALRYTGRLAVAGIVSVLIFLGWFLTS